MAGLSTTTVGGTPVPGLSMSIGGVNAPATPSVGVKAASPTTNVTPPTNTLTKSQAAPVNDLSSTYANVNCTIYNKQTGTAYSTPQQFFTASGVNSFNNLKFDTTWQPTPITPNPPTPPQQSSGVVPPLPTPTQTSTPSTLLPANNGATYTPPNGGTTGVSQGGLIGNLVGLSQNQNPNYVAAQNQVTNLGQQMSTLASNAAQQNANISGTAFGMSEGLGREGIIQNLLAAKQAALAPQYQAAQAELAAANTQSGQQTTAAQGAASANAPITGVPIGTQNISPSQPVSGLNTGQSGQATTSGAANLSSLIGQRPSPSNPGVTEFYNTQTGQGFATPQALADFVNQQQPGINANASNVFDLLKNNASAGGGANGLNPLANINNLAQAVVNGTMSPSQALAQGGNVANFQGALTAAIQQISPGFNFNTAEGSSTAQAATTAQQQQLQATYTSAKQQAQNLTSQFTNLIGTYGLNPQDLNAANGVIQTIAKNTSDWRYSALQNYVTDITNTYAAILGAGGTVTNDVRDTAQGMLDSLASGQSMTATIAALDQQAQAKIAGTQTAPITQSQGNGVGDNGADLYNF